MTTAPSIASNDVLFSCPECHTEMCVSPENASVTGPCIGCGAHISAHSALVAAAQTRLFEETVVATEPVASCEAPAHDLSYPGVEADGKVFSEQAAPPVNAPHQSQQEHVAEAPAWTGAWSSDASPAAETFEDPWEQTLDPHAPDPGARFDTQGYEGNSSLTAINPPETSDAMKRAQTALFGIGSEEPEPVVERRVEPLRLNNVEPVHQSYSPQPSESSEPAPVPEPVIEHNDPVLEERRRNSPFLPDSGAVTTAPLPAKARTPSPGEYDVIDQDFIGKTSEEDSHLPPPRESAKEPHSDDSGQSGFVPNRVIAQSSTPLDDSWKSEHRRRKRTRRRSRQVEDNFERVAKSHGWEFARASLAVAAIVCIGGFLFWAYSNDWGNQRHLSIQAEKRAAAERTGEPGDSLASQADAIRELPGGGASIAPLPESEISQDQIDTSPELEPEPW